MLGTRVRNGTSCSCRGIGGFKSRTLNRRLPFLGCPMANAKPAQSQPKTAKPGAAKVAAPKVEDLNPFRIA